MEEISPQDRHSGNGPLTSPNRRKMMFGLGLAGGAMAGALTQGPALAASSSAGEVAEPDQISAARQPFYGVHQSGITNPRPPAGLVVAFDVLATTRGDLERLLRKLTERIAFLTQGGPAPEIDPKFPALDSGLLGPIVTPGNLTMTVAVGASIFDARFGLAGAKPSHLERMPQFPNDALEAESCHGDLLIQICSDTPDTGIHALRDIIKNFPDSMAVRWKIDGYNSRPPAANQPSSTPRNLLGFKDGTANPNPADDGAMDRLVWVAPELARAGLGGRRQLSGRAHHPQFRRTLGSNSAAGAANDHRSRKDDRRPADDGRRDKMFPTMPPIQRASVSGSMRISGSPIRAQRRARPA